MTVGQLRMGFLGHRHRALRWSHLLPQGWQGGHGVLLVFVVSLKHLPWNAGVREMCAELPCLPLGMMDLQYLLSKLSRYKHLANLGRELLQDILRYLHRIGLVVWYEEIKHLESTVFLQPTFLITMFKVSVGIRTVFSSRPKLCNFAGLLSVPPLLSFSSHPAPGEVPPSPTAREHLCGHTDR